MKQVYSYCVFIFFFIITFASCKNDSNDTFLIEGKIKNLSTPELFIVTGSQDNLQVDTILVDKKGSFSFKGSANSLLSVMIYMENGNAWVTVWVKNGQRVSLFGDVVYPELILAKGTEINDLLSEFKKQNYDIIKERRDLIDRKNAIEKEDSSIVNIGNKHQYASKILNLNYSLKEKAENFILENPGSFASLVLFHDYVVAWEEPQEALRILEHIVGEPTETDFYRDMLRDLNNIIMRMEQAKVGSEAPDFSVLAINGKDTINLNSFKDKYLLLSFTASWCEFCFENDKELDRIRKEVSKSKLGMLTIALDRNKKLWKKLAKVGKLNWDYSVDTLEWLSPIAYSYNVDNIPTNILIDKNRIIVGRDLPADSVMRLCGLDPQSLDR